MVGSVFYCSFISIWLTGRYTCFESIIRIFLSLGLDSGDFVFMVELTAFWGRRDLSLGLGAWLPAFWVVMSSLCSCSRFSVPVCLEFLEQFSSAILSCFISWQSKVHSISYWFFSTFLFCSTTFIDWLSWTWWKTHIIRAVSLPALLFCLSAFGTLFLRIQWNLWEILGGWEQPDCVLNSWEFLSIMLVHTCLLKSFWSFSWFLLIHNYGGFFLLLPLYQRPGISAIVGILFPTDSLVFLVIEST